MSTNEVRPTLHARELDQLLGVFGRAQTTVQESVQNQSALNRLLMIIREGGMIGTLPPIKVSRAVRKLAKAATDGKAQG